MRRKVILSAFALLIVISPYRHEAKAQTERTVQQKDVRGRDTQVPYLRQNEYREISLMDDSMTRKTSEKSSRHQPTFGNLLTVASLDEVTRLIGKPKSTERRELSGGMFIGILRYDGLRMEYLKTGPETVRLRKLDITSPKWLVTINGKEFRPGTDIRQLSPSVRQSIQDFERPPSDNPDVDAAAVLHIAGSTKKGTTAELEKNTRFSFRINKETGTIEAIGFLRLI